MSELEMRIEYYEKKTISRIYYVDPETGMKNGECIEYYHEKFKDDGYPHQGPMKKQYYYKNDKMHGPYREYDYMWWKDQWKGENQILIKECTYHEGKLAGSYERYDDNGRLTLWTYYILGKQYGPYIRYNHGKVVEEYETREYISVDGKECIGKVGYHREYCNDRDCDRVIYEVYYDAHGLRQGKEYMFNRDCHGFHYSTLECTYKDDKLNGEYFKMFYDGYVRAKYKKGILNGILRGETCDASFLNIKFIIHFKDGLLDMEKKGNNKFNRLLRQDKEKIQNFLLQHKIITHEFI